MKVSKVDLKQEYPFLQGGTLDCMLGDYPFDGDKSGWKRPAVIVVPGGGYRFVSKREGEPIAHFFLAKATSRLPFLYAITIVRN